MGRLVEIREFSSGDLPAASRITEHIWGEECGTLPPDLSRMIYEYLVRYYYVPDSSLSLAAADGENTLRAFLLAAAGEYSHKAADEWAARNCPAEGRGFFNAYRAYLDGNGDAVRRMLKEKEVRLLLFGSLQKGAGSLLLNELVRRCRGRGVSSLLLWTDDTCDFAWYDRRGFSLAAEFDAIPSLPGRKLRTLVFRKEL